MFKDHSWLNFSDDLHIELQQGEDEGKETRQLKATVERIQSMDIKDPERERLAQIVYDEVYNLPVSSSFSYIEPSDYEGIVAARPTIPRIVNRTNICRDRITMMNKVQGAWLGRCIGCVLGKPIENWYREKIMGLLEDTGNYPVQHFISSDLDHTIVNRYKLNTDTYNNRYWINKLEYAPEDDDTNYVLVALKLLESIGREFSSEHVAENWLNSMPILNVATAERIAYRNLVNGFMPPQSAIICNPYREWIGAQIRSDFYGYVNPCQPETAANMAWRDASISHVKNGIYGSMFIASVIAAGHCLSDVSILIQTGLSQIPLKSRFAEAIRDIVTMNEIGASCEDCVQEVHRRFNEKNMHTWCHVIPNAMVVAISLLYGQGNFEKSIGIAVSAGFDTDCNGATVGSIMGLINGADNLPKHWVCPLNGRLGSGVRGFGTTSMSELSERTMRLISV